MDVDNGDQITVKVIKDAMGENKDTSNMNIDVLLENTGPCGRFQWLLQVLFAVLVISVAHYQVNVYFLGDDPSWKCVNNSTNAFCKKNYGRQIPSDDKDFYRRCQMNQTDWSYSVHKKYSFVTEFDLVCKKTWIAAIIIGSFYIGGVFGTLPAGTIADMYGRKIVMIVTATIILASSICCSLVTNYWQLLVLRFILGGAVMSCYAIGFVYLSEIVAPSYRTVSTVVYQTIFFCLSHLLVTTFAYFEREWRKLQFYVSFGCIIPAIFLILFPNSPRWLLQNGKPKDALKVLRRMAKCNNKTLNADIDLKCDGEKKQQTSYSYLHLFNERKMLCLTILLSYNYFTVAMLYFAITLQSSKLGGNMYQSFVLTTLADSPSFFASWYGCNRYGRKKTVLGTLVGAGLCLGGCALVTLTYKPKYIINVTLSTVAKFLTNISFVSIFVWGVELYPTVIRSQGFAYCVAVERVGAFVAPFLINLLREIDYRLPYVIMMVMSALCGFTGLVLPETLGTETKETLEDFYEDFRIDKKERSNEDIKTSCENNGFEDL